jgi:glycosyltransferase involved in cell wall biosynthesis
LRFSEQQSPWLTSVIHFVSYRARSFLTKDQRFAIEKNRVQLIINVVINVKVETDHRVVFVSGSIKLGGASTFLLNLGGELVRRGISVLVISLEYENPYASDFELLGIPLHVEDERTTIFEDRLSSALHAIRHFQPTAVISCLGPSSYEILRYVPRWVTRLGMVQSDYPEVYPPVAAYVPFFDGTIGVSEQIVANLRAHPVLGTVPAYYLPYGVPVPQNTVRRTLERGGPIRILYFGRVCRAQKRVHLFPEILRQLRAAQFPFQWTIAGEGSERSWLQSEMISASPMSSIEFPGAIAYRDVPRLLDSHDIFLLASHAEGLPLSLLEAMSHGLVPVVSNLASGVSEVVNERCGVLVDPDNIDGYAAGIVWLSQNPSVFSALSKNARERVRTNYSVAAMTDRWLSVLKPLETPVSWPRHINILGPIMDRRQWMYAPLARFFRRLLKRLRIAAIFDLPFISN